MQPRRPLDNLHNHATWSPRLREEYCEDGRLHRHRIIDDAGAVHFTSWAHNTPAHHHRLPDGAWARPKTDLNPLPLAAGARR